MSNDGVGSGEQASQVDGEKLEEAYENTKPLMDAASSLVNAGVASVAQEKGRTVEEQWERMGDHFEYQAVEQNPSQKQLDDYEIGGQTVGVKR